jgi:hypothetical protein
MKSIMHYKHINHLHGAALSIELGKNIIEKIPQAEKITRMLSYFKHILRLKSNLQLINHKK